MILEVTDQAAESDDNYVIQRTREYNSRFVENAYRPLSVFFRNEDGNIIAGLTGKTFWDWLHIEYLWVDEARRGQGLGSRLLRAAENEAIARACIGSTLDTFSFQALEFYKKQGYSQLGSLSGYAGDYSRHYLEKKLLAAD